MSSRALRKSVSTVILLGLVVLLMAAGGAGAGGCKTVQGKVTLQPVTDPAQCSSVYGCGTGTIKGDLRGTFDVVTTSFVQSLDFATTGVVFTTADTVFTVLGGTLLSKDAVTLSMFSGDYAEVITITGGTGVYQGATGTLTAAGGTTATGASGAYRGTICTP